MPNVRLKKKTDLSSFRRVAIGTWRTSKDCQVYGSMTLRMDDALAYRDEFRRKTGRRLTVTHMLCKACAAVFEKMPDANAILRGNSLYLRDEIALFFQVSFEDPKTGEIDLSGITVREPEKKSLLDVLNEFEERAAKVRALKDKELESTRATMQRIPLFAIGWFMNLLSFFLYRLNVSLPGVPKDAFGTAMITNIGTLGLEEAYPPLVPYSHVPLVLAVGSITETPVVDGSEVSIAQTMKIFATFDHRVLDGMHAATMSKTLKAWFDDPKQYFGEIPERVPELIPKEETQK